MNNWSGSSPEYGNAYDNRDELSVWEARELQKKLLGYEPVVVVNFPDWLRQGGN